MTAPHRPRPLDAVLRRPRSGFPALDGLRAISVLLVVFFHATSWVHHNALAAAGVDEVFAGPAVSIVPGSVHWFLTKLWFGVDVFFVLSGFLIGRMLLQQLATGRVDFRAFYVRRMARILPAYYAVLVVTVVLLSRLPAFAWLYGTLSREELLIGALKDALFVNNYLRARPEVISWAWSLCVEEHFYLVMPLCLTMLFRVAPSWRLAALAALPLVPAALRAGAYHANPRIVLWDGAHFTTHTHCEGLLLGVLIAYLHLFHRERLRQTAARWQGAMLLATVAAFGAFFAYGGVFQVGVFAVVGQLFLLAVGIAFLVTLSITVANPVTRGLAHPVWYPIARVSYGIYLVHPLVVLALLHVNPVTPSAMLQSPARLLALGTLTAACAFLVACVLFLTIELPMLRWGARVAGTSPSRGDAGPAVDPSAMPG